MPAVNDRDAAASSGISISNPYQKRFFLKRIFYHKRLFGPALDHAIVRAIGNACVRILRRHPDRLFSSVEIETINRCNSLCSFCPGNKRSDPRPLAYMSDELFSKILDDLASLDYAGKLALHSNNEPLLDEAIVERVRQARRKCPRAFVFIYTNGTRLSLDRARQLLDAGIDLIRIDNYSDRLKLHRNIRELVESFRQPPYVEHADKIRIVVRRLTEVLSNRGGAAPNKPSAQDDSYRYYESASCRYPFDQLVIRPDGKVSLCGNDAYGKVTLGDTNRQSLLEIWHGEDYRRLRAELATNGRKNLPVCNRCDVHTFDPDVFLERSRMLRFLNRTLGLSSSNWK
jgi:radical SAM protein with 4Fe4S-binding SPASM domain